MQARIHRRSREAAATAARSGVAGRPSSDGDEQRWVSFFGPWEVPTWITKAIAAEAAAATTAKKQLPALSKIRFERYDEGRSLQLLHVGSYDDEAPKLNYLHTEYMPDNLAFNGRHHEIYLSDPRKTAPAKLKTILRQPVRHL